MNFINHLYNLDNGSICIYPNYNRQIIDRDSFTRELINELNVILSTNGRGNKFIVLIDLSKMNITPDHASCNIFFYKNLKKTLEKTFNDKLDKIIIYEYTKTTVFFIKLLKLILDKDLTDKIIIDKGFYDFFENGIKKNLECNSITVNNNVSHY